MEYNILPQPYETWFMTFFFVYLRVAAAVFTLPILSNESIIPAVRAGLAFWIAVVLLGPLWGLNEAVNGPQILNTTRVFSGFVELILAAMAEVVFGMALGFIGQMILLSVSMAGEIIGQQAGFSAASVLDPVTGQDVFLLEQITILFATLLFIVIGGPEMTLSVLADSFQVMRPGEGFRFADFSEAGAYTLIYDEGRRFALANMMYKVAIQIAAPVMVAMILISIAEAFIARTVPQLNILVVGFAVRIAISLIILTAFMPFFLYRYKQYLMQYVPYAEAFLRRMLPGTA